MTVDNFVFEIQDIAKKTEMNMIVAEKEDDKNKAIEESVKKMQQLIIEWEFHKMMW